MAHQRRIGLAKSARSTRARSEEQDQLSIAIRPRGHGFLGKQEGVPIFVNPQRLAVARAPPRHAEARAPAADRQATQRQCDANRSNHRKRPSQLDSGLRRRQLRTLARSASADASFAAAPPFGGHGPARRSRGLLHGGRTMQAVAAV